MKTLKQIIDFNKSQHLTITNNGRRDRAADVKQVYEHTIEGISLVVKHRIGLI